MKNTKNITSTLDYADKIPPQAIDIEEAILGALMLENDAILQISGSIRPEMFYKDVHQKIYSGILELSLKGKQIDLMTVSEILRKNECLDEVGGPYYIAQLTNKVASASNIEYHSLILSEKFTRRELIRISSEIQQQSFDDSVDTLDILDSINTQLDNINSNSVHVNGQKTWIELMKETIEAAKKREILFMEGKYIGIPTPLLKLTKWTCGWQPKQFIVIAGRPGMGKTAWALGCAKTSALSGYKPAMFTLEMSDVSLANRIIVGESGVNSDDFRSGNISGSDWVNLDKAIQRLWDLKISIDDKPKNVNRIVAKIKALHKKGLCDLAIIDYIQLSSDDSNGKGNREQEVSAISRKLKLCALELDIPIIALSQLNRSVESRAIKKPQLSDLRESGAIEQDADLVIFTHVPEKYGIMEDPDTHELLNGRCDCILEKQREGQVGTINFKFNDSYTAIYDWDDNNFTESLPIQTNPNPIDPNSRLEPNKGFDENGEAPF